MNRDPHDVQPGAAITYVRACTLAGREPLREPRVRYRFASGAGGVLSPGDVIRAGEGMEILVEDAKP